MIEPVMLPVCRRFATDATDAEDILQAGFLRVFQKLHQFRFEGAFEAWARRIMINTAINHRRQQSGHQQQVSLEQLESYISPQTEIESQISAADLMRVIGDLPNRYQAVFSMHEIEGYDHKEISDRLGICEGTSKSLLHRARALIRKRLETLGITN